MAQTKKRRINRKKQIKRLSLLVLIIVLIIFLFVSNFNRMRLWIKGYGFSEQNILLRLDKSWLNEYLELDSALDLETWDTVENDHHYIDYVNYSSNHDVSNEQVVQYVDSFYELYGQLEQAGFSIETCRELMDSLTIDDFQAIVDAGYKYEDIQGYLDINGVIVSDIAAYIDSGLDPLDAVMNVSYPFIDSQNTITTNYQIMEPDDLLVLVKHGFGVSSDYVPDDLVSTNIMVSDSNPDPRLRKEAAEALEKMAEDASKEGYTLAINSAYRSYEDQQAVYDEYFTMYDPVTAASLVAVPGYSEHQLGLSVDLTCKDVIDGVYGVFGDSPDYDWTIAHAHEYGFILRYPEDKTAITGTANEPWHYRYVGVEAATEIYENGWTLEEYIQHHGFTYDLSPE